MNQICHQYVEQNQKISAFLRINLFFVFKCFHVFCSVSSHNLFLLLEAAAEVDIGKLSSIKKYQEKLLEKHPHLKTGGGNVNVNTNENIGINNEVECIIPKVPPYFNIVNLKSIDEQNKIIHLEVRAQNIPPSVTGDECVVNLKGSMLLGEIYGIKSPLSICTAHVSCIINIKQLCTLQTMC